MEQTKRKDVIVLGAGVVGLTTALMIQERGVYDVTIIAEVLPEDPKSIRYTSHWAGAHHISTTLEDKQKFEMETETFDVMWKMSAPGSDAEECFLRIPHSELLDIVSEPEILEHMPDFTQIPESALLPGAVSGLAVTTVTIDTPVYLHYLRKRFVKAGGEIIRGYVQHINQVIEGGAGIFREDPKPVGPPDAVIVCVGLGARSLGGVEDKDVYPIRGQTVILKAPWVRFGKTMSWMETEVVSYVIPRRSGDVVVGGTRDVDDWYPKPRPETKREILERAVAFCPELAPPHNREAKAQPTIDDLLPLVVGEGCGLRPARRGGIRLEAEMVRVHGGRKVPVVYNYGHGGYGFQSSWGAASKAVELLTKALGGV